MGEEKKDNKERKVSRTRGRTVTLVLGENHIDGNHNLKNCTVCGVEFEKGPHEIIVQHRVDGIDMIGVCSRDQCFEEVGKRMSEGKR